MKFYFTACLLFIALFAHAHTIKPVSSAVSTSGLNQKVIIEGKSLFVGQSIGQQGIAGKGQRGSLVIYQGYLKPLFRPSGGKNTLDLRIKVFPNPFNQFLEINFRENVSQSEIAIIDISGRTLYREITNGSKSTIDASVLKPGLYVIMVRVENQTYTQKILKLEE